MYCKEKPLKHENQKPRKTHKNMPSFSSTLLDEICRSIDGNGGSPEDFPAYGEIPASGFRAKSSTKEEEMASFSRACSVQKWMEKEVNEKNAAKKLENSVFPYNDLLFLSSNSSSSDGSCALSSSDTEFFCSTAKSKLSCSVKMPKPVKIGVSPRVYNQQDFILFDDHQNHQKNRVDDDLMKSKSKALKIYANLKKLKQPISPGAKLTSLINSFFTNMNRKKPKNVDRNQELNCPDYAASSSSSFSRPCLSKNPGKSSERMTDGTQRSVGFHPVGVVVDQDSKKCIYNEGCDIYGRPPLPPNAILKVQNQRRKCDFSMFSKIQNKEDEDDAFSESSSDLFELDHLSLFGNNDGFCEELPVYETTYFDKNRGLIR